MNYYKFNIGDYAAATRHLTMLEHGAYRLLLDLYYTTEKPIPSDIKAAARKAGARSKDEIQAVDTVLVEFFTLSPAGWVHSRCEAEIAEYMEGSEERAKKEANEKERMRRHRERRSEMFEALRTVGVVPAWDVPMKELQRLYNEKCNTPETDLQRVAGVATETPATAKPLTTNQEPINTPIPPSQATGAGSAKQVAVSLPAWLATMKAKGEAPLPETDPVFDYADEAGIPIDMLRLCWVEFRARYSEPGAKRYKDWRAVYRKAVRGNWLRLWHSTGDGYILTTAGQQAQRAIDAKVAA